MANNSSNCNTYLMIGGAALVIAILISLHKNSEGFRHRREEAQALEQKPMEEVPMRPSLAAPLSPRFDGVTNGSQALVAGEKAPIALQGAPMTPTAQDVNVDFSQLGGVAAPVPTGALTSKQVGDILSDRFGSEAPKYQDTEELMPVPDMRYTAGIDPTDPESFMYDRTIFGKLKRRYGNGVDYFRGDIDVKPQYRGWFDIQPPKESDVVKGYFDRYVDIQQETEIQDATFTRATPVDKLFQATLNPWGSTVQNTPYGHV